MNATQMKYLFSQLDTIGTDLRQKIDEAYPDFPSFIDKVALIRDGVVPLKPTADLGKYSYLCEAYDFTGRDIDREEIRREKKAALQQRIQDLKNTVVFDGNVIAQEVVQSARTMDVSDL